MRQFARISFIIVCGSFFAISSAVSCEWVGTWQLPSADQILIGESDGQLVATLPDGRIRGLRPAPNQSMAYGNALGDRANTSGSMLLVGATNGSKSSGACEQLSWQDGAGSPVLARRIPHLEVEARFDNGNVSLSGTLYLPISKEPVPAIVMAHGSGKELRSRSGLVFAFVANGIAVLSFDKRGSGKSTGTWRASFTDYAADLVSGVEWLRSRPEVNLTKIGAWGHSQGAWIAPLAASMSANIAFVVAQAGGGVTPVEQDLFHSGNMLGLKTKLTPAQIAEVATFRRLKYDVLTGRAELAVYDAALEVARKQEWFRNVGAALPNAEFWKTNAHYDPAATIARVQCPLLFILADKDAYGPTETMLKNIERVFAETRRPEQRVTVLRNANHALFEADRLALLEDTLPATDRLANGYQTLLLEWVRSRVR